MDAEVLLEGNVRFRNRSKVMENLKERLFHRNGNLVFVDFKR